MIDPRDEAELRETAEAARQIVKGLRRHLRDANEVFARLEELLERAPTQPRTAERGAQHGYETKHHPIRA